MTTDRLLSIVWLVGLVLVILSWVKVVPPMLGMVGAGITLVTWVVTLMRNRKR